MLFQTTIKNIKALTSVILRALNIYHSRRTLFRQRRNRIFLSIKKIVCGIDKKLTFSLIKNKAGKVLKVRKVSYYQNKFIKYEKYDQVSINNFNTSKS